MCAIQDVCPLTLSGGYRSRAERRADDKIHLRAQLTRFFFSLAILEIKARR